MKNIILFTFFLMSALSVYAQPDTSKVEEKVLYLIVKTDGNEFYGFILKDDGREILLETKSIGKIFINKSEIAKIEKVDEVEYTESGDIVYTDFRSEGAFTTRYYFTTNALPIKKKDNYAMIHLYGPEVHFAVSDKLSVGVMATWIASPIALALKYSFNSTGKTHLALGTIVGSSGYLLQARGFGGLHWLTVTHGDRKKNFSFSAGYAYVGGLSGLFGSNINLGRTVKAQSFDENEEFYVGNYDAERAVYNKYNNNISDYLTYQSKDVKGSAVIGLSGIIPVGEKASFIFDAMGFISGDDRVNYTAEYDAVTEEFTYDTYDYASSSTITVTEDLTFGKNGRVVKSSNTAKATIIMMPAMRFSKSYKSSFQVALAGVININSRGGSAFPAPMVSWLKKF